MPPPPPPAARRAAGLALAVALGAVLVAAPERPAPGADDRPARKRPGAEGHEPQTDRPDGFLRYHAQIRAVDVGGGPAYRVGYQARALDAARLAAKGGAALPWQEHGPGNVAGRARALVVDRRDPTGNTWYQGTAGGGVWKTTNAGGAWANVSAAMPNLAVSALAQTPSAPATFYAGTGEGFGNADAVLGAGVFRSTDGGASWALLPATATADFRAVNRLVVAPADAAVVVAATTAGVFRTTNGGATWAAALRLARGAHQVVATGDFGALYAASQGTCSGAASGTVYRSADGGATWAPASTGLALPAGTGRIEIALAPTDAARLYASVEGCDGDSHLFASANGGGTWAEVLPASTTNAPDWLNGQGWYDNALAVHPYNRDVVLAGGLDLFRLTTTGAGTASATFTASRLTDWTGGSRPYVHADQHSITTIPVNPTLGTFRTVVTNDGGVFEAADGLTTWTARNTGLGTAQFYGVDKAPNAVRFVGGTQDNGSWTSPAAGTPTAASGWASRLGGDGFEAVWGRTDPTRFVVSLYNNALYRGATTSPLLEDLTGTLGDLGEDGPFITTVAKTNADPDLLFVTGASGVWRSDDFGTTWDLAEFASGADLWGYNGLRTPAAVSPADARVVWAGTRMSPRGRPFVSTDGGATFAPVPALAPGANGLVTGLAPHPTDARAAYVLLSTAGVTKIYRTTDLGASWQPLTGAFTGGPLSSNGFPDVAVYSLLPMPHAPNVLWAGTEIGLFVSSDGGASWAFADDGLPAVALWSLRIADGRVVAATHGRGVWSVALPELAAYTEPPTVRAPRLLAAAQRPAGAVEVRAEARAALDSAHVLLDGAVLARRVTPLAAGEVLQASPALAVTTPTTVTAQVVGFRGGQRYASAAVRFTVAPTRAPVVTYRTSFDDGAADFAATGFALGQPAGFASRHLGTAHPYADATNAVATLLPPIRVASAGAVLRYRDVAIVEPGKNGSVFGDEAFYDYVVVEGSKDGATWVPLAPGYDARANAGWRATYDAGGAGTAAGFVQHEVNLLNTFAPGDVVQIRFRLYADASVSGWGWAVDDLEIQPAAVAAEGPAAPLALALDVPYPNPFRSGATVAFTLPQAGRATLRLFDVAGRQVAVLAEGARPAGRHTVRVPADGLAAGLYVVRLDTPAGTRTRTLTRVR